MGPHSQDTHLLVLPSSGALCLVWGPAEEPVGGMCLRTHLDQAPQTAGIEPESQERKPESSVVHFQADMSLRVGSTWPIT